jgi:hypothetical protein
LVLTAAGLHVRRVQAFRRELGRRPAAVIKEYLRAIQTREDLLGHMHHLETRNMLFVGTRSPFANEGYVHRLVSTFTPIGFPTPTPNLNPNAGWR